MRCISREMCFVSSCFSATIKTLIPDAIWCQPLLKREFGQIENPTWIFLLKFLLVHFYPYLFTLFYPEQICPLFYFIFLTKLVIIVTPDTISIFNALPAEGASLIWEADYLSRICYLELLLPINKWFWSTGRYDYNTYWHNYIF